jgi:hypothetical protein
MSNRRATCAPADGPADAGFRRAIRSGRAPFGRPGVAIPSRTMSPA